MSFPRDLAIVKTHQYWSFNRGNSPGNAAGGVEGRGRGRGHPYVHGMTAFAYEQCHLLEEAESQARGRDAPQAQGALGAACARPCAADPRADGRGCAVPRIRRRHLDRSELVMVTHLWWHLALFYLSQGRDRQALELYDLHCWGVAKNTRRTRSVPYRCLARFEIAGIDVGTRWQDLADHLAARAQDTVLPFLTLQYLYGLARAGRARSPHPAGVGAPLCRGTRPPFEREVWRERGPPRCEGLYAHARGDHEAAWRHLSAARPRAGGGRRQPCAAGSVRSNPARRRDQERARSIAAQQNARTAPRSGS